MGRLVSRGKGVKKASVNEIAMFSAVMLFA